MHNEVSIRIQFEMLQCWYYGWEVFIKYAIEMASDGLIYVPSFMEMGTGVQAILRFCFSTLRGCDVGIADGRDV
jgi:hypothetical protein